MLQRLHRNARTNYSIRREIKTSSLSVSALASNSPLDKQREKKFNRDMETGTGVEIAEKSPQTSNTVIKEGRLPVYEQAAEKTGYGLKVTAQAGEEILVEDLKRREVGKYFIGELKGTFHKVKVSPGSVGVVITIPPGQEKRGTTPFFNVVKELGRSPK